jgi:phosphatidate phosphatase APP1
VGAASLRAFDELAVAGKVVTLRAKLERGKAGRDVKGAKISFEILHVPKSAEEQKPVYQKLCETFTDSDGVAAAELKGFFAGRHLIRCTYLACPEVKAVSRVFVIKPEMPILVTDIDRTIADISTLGFLTSKPEDVPVMPGAVEALQKLSKKYLVVYLTARDDTFLPATMEWLQVKGFPEGPVFFSDLSKTAFLGSARKFKSARLAVWRKAGINLKVGVGDRPEDAQAYLANNMEAFILTGKPDELAVRANAVKSWSEVADMLLK